MPKTRRLLTNFSKGELSPLIDGRPDLAAYFEGGKTVENFQILRQGGLERRVGTRFIHEVKNSLADTILIPFEASVDAAYQIEVGHLYMRFYKNKQLLLTSAGGLPVEVVSPYTEAQIRLIHFTQSVDVLFLFHPDVAQHKLSRLSDTDWVLQPISFQPPPSFEADSDISDGATLTPAATSGTDVLFLASAARFLEGDVGRAIIFGASRAIITGFGASAGDITSPNVAVRATILDVFFNTNPIPAGQWFLRLSPQTTLDPDIKGPVGAIAALVAGKPAFRNADSNKYFTIYGGLLRMTAFDGPSNIHAEILSEMTGTTEANPPAAPAGAWTMEVASWSAENGFPRTGEFFQGRLGQGGTRKQPTTWWLSTSDDFENYATGAEADRAIEYTIASRNLDQIVWLADRKELFIGTVGAEMYAQSGKTDEPFGGDVVPLVRRATSHGSSPIQPFVIGANVMFVNRTRNKVFSIVYQLEQDNFDALETTGISEHIFGSGIRLGPIAFAKRPDPRLFFIREDGVLVTLTYFVAEKVIGFTRFVTNGTFESVSVIPSCTTHPDQVWVVVKRIVNGAVKRYVELFDPEHSSLTTRLWKSLQTDCAIVYNGVPTTIVTGLAHIEGFTVDIVADGGYRGTKVVSGGQVVLSEEFSEIEVGLHYDSTVESMRPAVQGQVIEGIPRSWDTIWLRLFKTLGGIANGEPLKFSPTLLGALELFTGDKLSTGKGWDTDGRIKIEQKLPYPMTLLAVFGTLSLGDSD